MKFYFELAWFNVEFATTINNGVRPDILDENGNTNIFVVEPDGHTAVISSDDDKYLALLEEGTQMLFQTPR